MCVLFLALSVIAASAPVVRADDYNCSCVTYVRSQTGLPGGPNTAGDYQESVMNSFGWHRVQPLNTSTGNMIPSGGKTMIMIWDPNQKGAYGDGHMAITTQDPWYNYNTNQWVVSVQHVDWLGNCGVEGDTFTNWGDLYGINFYVQN